MQLNRDNLKQWSLSVSSQTEAARPQRGRPLLALGLVLTFITLACAFSGGSRSASTEIMQPHLPTLTRTPLPTLTPTSAASPVAAIPAEAGISSSPSSSLPDNPTVAAVAAVETAPASQPAESAPVVPAEPPAVANSAVIASPTPLPTATPAAASIPPTDTPIPTATTMPTPVPTETPTPTVTPTPQLWAFNGVRLYPNPYDDGMLLYGNLVNNTGAAQKVTSVLGTFFDAQNQVIAGPDSGESYSPAYVVAPGAGAPFELAVETIENAANFNLNVMAEPSDETPRQDFEFSDVEQWTDEANYCVGGELKNQGGELHDYLVIALILYDAQENTVSFSYYEELEPDWVNDDDTLEFELCADTLGQAVAHHTLQTWGR